MLSNQPNIAPGERSPAANTRTLRSTHHDHVTLFATGVTVPEAVAAHDLLATRNIRARVIDLDANEPLDTSTVLQAASQTGNIVVAEDHRPEGGIGQAVRNALTDADSDARVQTLAVHAPPSRPERPDERLWRAGIDHKWITTAARDVLEQLPPQAQHRRGLASLLHRLTTFP
jgi:transketolase